MKVYSSIFIILFALVCFSSCRQSTKAIDQQDATSDSNNMATLSMAPDFTLKSLDGNTVSLNSFKGKYVVLHIATTWCPYCNAEAPYLEELYKNYKDKNVAVLIIDVKESRELIKEKLQDKYNFTFPVLIDSDGAVAASYAPKDVLPELARDEIMLASNLLVDPEGKILFMSLLDTKNFDVQLVQLKSKLDELLL
jgi:peroxiredoxin